jgi:carbon monoxide dehydrogenase subunit G
MPAVQKSITINAAPEKVWGLLQNPNHWHTWFEGVAAPKSVQGDGGVGTAVETSITVANIPLPTKIQVTEIVPARHWKGEFSGVATKGTQVWTYAPADGGTQLTFQIEAELSGPAKLAEGLVVGTFEKMSEKTLANVKALAEA